MTNKLSPSPFWRPIEECPKKEGEEYFVIVAGLGASYAVCHDGFLEVARTEYFEYVDTDITHFAKIPPLPQDKE